VNNPLTKHSSDATMAEAALETVLRRDRIVVAAALAGLAMLAWVYVLWLAADMDMGGMDMTGFRMIPAGLEIMAPANAPWGAIEFVCACCRPCFSSGRNVVAILGNGVSALAQSEAVITCG
jgi:predicted metal-binding membrane protein